MGRYQHEIFVFLTIVCILVGNLFCMILFTKFSQFIYFCSVWACFEILAVTWLFGLLLKVVKFLWRQTVLVYRDNNVVIDFFFLSVCVFCTFLGKT